MLKRKLPRALGWLAAGALVWTLLVTGGAAMADGPDTAGYAKLLATYVDENGLVNYAGLKADRRGLDAYVAAAGRVDPRAFQAWSAEAKIAFLINAYNAMTLQLVIDNYPIASLPRLEADQPESSIRQIPRAWDTESFILMNKWVSLNRIEHEYLRAQFDEPEIHAALVCAALGCPRLRREPYAAQTLHEQLADQSRRYIRGEFGMKIDREAGTVALSKIFQWYGGDFVRAYGGIEEFAAYSKNQAAVLNYAAQNATEADAQYLKKGGYTVTYLPYDWSLNAQP